MDLAARGESRTENGAKARTQSGGRKAIVMVMTIAFSFLCLVTLFLRAIRNRSGVTAWKLNHQDSKPHRHRLLKTIGDLCLSVFVPDV
jgi:hypothetical protein